MKKLLNLRTLVTIFLAIWWLTFFITHGFDLAFGGIALLAASILFAINSRKTDYVAFSIFMFAAVIVISGKIQYCLERWGCFEPNHMNYFYGLHVPLFFLVSLILGVLAFSFFRNEN